MPRLAPTVVRHASRQSKYLAALLGQCRTLESASNELRWLKENVENGRSRSKDGCAGSERQRLGSLVKRRARGEPLQYILGTQPFGELEILCRPKVLIPRTDTETYITGVLQALEAVRFKNGTRNQPMRILDLCCGSGCIALLMHSLLRRNSSITASRASAFEPCRSNNDLEVLGLDLSPDALRLSNDNLKHNLANGALHSSAKSEVVFRQADVIALATREAYNIPQQLETLIGLEVSSQGPCWDVLVSNPPYVSLEDYAIGGRTERSVRNFEPEMALVPPQTPDTNVRRADLFYPPILRIARHTGVRLVVMEIGDEDQAERVRQLVSAELNDRSEMYVETWYDDGGIVANRVQSAQVVHSTRDGHSSGARAVVVWLGDWGRQRRLTYLR